MRRTLAVAIAMTLGSAASAQTIYDNLSAGTNEQVIADLVPETGVFDDLNVSGGGVLATITAAGKNTGFGDSTLDPTVHLFMDDGDGLPEFGGDDGLLLSAQTFGILFPGGFSSPVVEFSFDVSAQNVAIPDGARVWAGVVFGIVDFQSASHAYYGMPVVGSTDDFVYRVDGMGGLDIVQVPAVQEPDFFGLSRGLGFKLTLVPEPSALALLGLAGLCLLRRRV